MNNKDKKVLVLLLIMVGIMGYIGYTVFTEFNTFTLSNPTIAGYKGPELTPLIKTLLIVVGLLFGIKQGVVEEG